MGRAFDLFSKLRARPNYLLLTDTKFAYALPLSFVWMRLLFYQPLFLFRHLGKTLSKWLQLNAMKRYNILKKKYLFCNFCKFQKVKTLNGIKNLQLHITSLKCLQYLICMQ